MCGGARAKVLIHGLRTRFLYLYVLAVIGPVAAILQATLRQGPTLFGHSPAVWIPVALVALASALWLIQGSAWFPSASLWLFSGAVIALWIYVLMREYSTGTGFNFSALVIPVALLLIATKPPDFFSARRSLDLLVLVLAGVAVIGWLLLLSGHEMPAQSAGGRGLLGFAPEFRWVGPFETPTQAGAVGGYLLLYAMWRKTWVFTPVFFLGSAVLVLSGSRGAMVATAVALVSMLWFKDSLLGVQLTWFVRTLVSAGTLAVGAVFVLFHDPTFNGRTPIWVEYLSKLLPQSPWIGIGSSGVVTETAQSRILTVNQDWVIPHAHNLFIDTATRVGVVGLVLAVAVLSITLAIATRAGVAGLWIAPSLAISWIINQVSDVHVDWRYLDHDFSILIFTVVLGATFLRTSTASAMHYSDRDTTNSSRSGIEP